MNRAKFAIFAPLFLIPLLATSYFFPKITSGINKAPLQAETANVSENKEVKNQDSLNLAEYSQLPSVGTITQHPVAGATKTAVLVTQDHLYPGSQPGDSVNDSAEIAQDQIYDVINHLYKDSGVNFIMAEGELYGNVTQDKIEKVATEIKLKDQFSAALDAAKVAGSAGSSGLNLSSALFASGDQVVKSLDREVALGGAAQELKASNPDITLYGSENSSTLAMCTLIVRKYIYLQDAQAQKGKAVVAGISPASAALSLNNSFISPTTIGQGSSATSNTSLNEFMTYLSLVKKLSPAYNNQGLQTSLDSLDQASQGLVKYYTDTQKASAVSAVSVPSRSDNPYLQESPSEIDSEMKQTEQDINDHVINQRNQETAQNFSKALDEKSAKVGILQFGAGHEEGLTKELNAQGISVVVISPKQVVATEDQK